MTTAVLKDSEFHCISEFVKPDNRSRLKLSTLLKGTPAGYAVYQNNTGQIVLDPVAVIPESELWLYRNPKALAAVREGIEQVGRGKVVHRGSFAKKYARLLAGE